MHCIRIEIDKRVQRKRIKTININHWLILSNEIAQFSISQSFLTCSVISHYSYPFFFENDQPSTIEQVHSKHLQMKNSTIYWKSSTCLFLSSANQFKFFFFQTKQKSQLLIEILYNIPLEDLHLDLIILLSQGAGQRLQKCFMKLIQFH